MIWFSLAAAVQLGGCGLFEEGGGNKDEGWNEDSEPPLVECEGDESLCESFRIYCWWSAEYRDPDTNYEVCVKTYDEICVDFPLNDICLGNAHCWANCVEYEGPEVEAVEDCICDNSCTNDAECN